MEGQQPMKAPMASIAVLKAYPGGGGPAAAVVYVIDMEEHPFDLAQLAVGRRCNVIAVTVRDWNNSLTPWPAPSPYPGRPDYEGNAATTLDELIGQDIPAIERQENLHPTSRAICGYSLGGLFALYSLAHSDAFRACASLSGSVWYEGWVEHLRSLELNGAGRFAFLSVGTKEKRARQVAFRTVEDNTRQCADILQARGFAVEFVTGPGDHMHYVAERFDAGLSALDAFLSA